MNNFTNQILIMKISQVHILIIEDVYTCIAYSGEKKISVYILKYINVNNMKIKEILCFNTWCILTLNTFVHYYVIKIKLI